MSTLKQIAANRRNSRKSTGPKTPEGKQSSRLNAIRHGLRARTVVQPGDDPLEFEKLCADLQKVLQPKDRPEQLLVEKMAIAEWQLARWQRSESTLLISLQGTIDAAHLPVFDRFYQIQARLERVSMRVYKELRQIANTRPQEKEGPPRKLTVTWVSPESGQVNDQIIVPLTPVKPNGQAGSSRTDPTPPAPDAPPKLKPN